MGIQVKGLAFGTDITHVAISEDQSYISMSHENQITVFCISPTDSQYRAQFRHTAASKVTSLSWSGEIICYRTEGDSTDQKARFSPGHQKVLKNTISDSTAFIFPKLRAKDFPDYQFLDVKGLLCAKLDLEEIPQQSDLIEEVPYEKVLQTIQSMSIGNAENYVETKLNLTEEKERVLRERCDPLAFLGKFIENPEKLLDLLRCTGAVITGSTALEYFCPGALVDGSDLDFYCPSDIETVALFTYHLSLMGVEWATLGSSLEEFLDYYAMGFKLLKGTLSHEGRIIDVQCIWSASQHRTASSNIFHFHSTMVQCFISGFAAVSLYDKYTSSKQGIHWTANDTNVARGQRHRKYIQNGVLSVEDSEVQEYTPGSGDKDQDELKIIKKYGDRGFKFVKYFSQGTIAHGNGSEIGCYGGRFRSVGDSGCRRVSFKPYIKHNHWDIPFDVYYDALSYISWFETAYKTTSTQGILYDDFPYERKSRTQYDKDWSGPNQIFDPMESSFATQLTNTGGSVETPWLGDDVILEDINKIFYAYRYPC
ncbi:hypothetical protein O988_02796 [Pseudogymnoascus sp. VKM F-3808]|nr:hypothetical protein O988_02796 [Pseudogymnoascus sp. VKM F-3808]